MFSGFLGPVFRPTGTGGISYLPHPLLCSNRNAMVEPHAVFQATTYAKLFSSAVQVKTILTG